MAGGLAEIGGGYPRPHRGLPLTYGDRSLCGVPTQGASSKQSMAPSDHRRGVPYHHEPTRRLQRGTGPCTPPADPPCPSRSRFQVRPGSLPASHAPPPGFLSRPGSQPRSLGRVQCGHRDTRGPGRPGSRPLPYHFERKRTSATSPLQTANWLVPASRRSKHRPSRPTRKPPRENPWQGEMHGMTHGRGLHRKMVEAKLLHARVQRPGFRTAGGTLQRIGLITLSETGKIDADHCEVVREQRSDAPPSCVSSRMPMQKKKRLAVSPHPQAERTPRGLD